MGALGSGGTGGTSGIGGLGNDWLLVMHLMTQPIMATTMATGIYLYARLTRFSFVFDFILSFSFALFMYFKPGHLEGANSGFALVQLHLQPKHIAFH
jgi:hypothetical protein